MKKMMTVFISLCVAMAAAGCSSGKEVKKAEIQKPLPLASIQVTPVDNKIKVGESIQLTAKGFDKNGKALLISTKWSLDIAGSKAGALIPVVGSASQVTFSAKLAGTVVVTAEADGIKGMTTIVISKSVLPVKKSLK